MSIQSISISPFILCRLQHPSSSSLIYHLASGKRESLPREKEHIRGTEKSSTPSLYMTQVINFQLTSPFFYFSLTASSPFIFIFADDICRKEKIEKINNQILNSKAEMFLEDKLIYFLL